MAWRPSAAATALRPASAAARAARSGTGGDRAVWTLGEIRLYTEVFVLFSEQIWKARSAVFRSVFGVFSYLYSFSNHSGSTRQV